MNRRVWLLTSWRALRKKIKCLYLIVWVFFLHGANIFALSISTEEAKKIGEKIWNNECRGTVEGLTSWNKGEHFASLGIGHFTWCPASQKGGFQETFPSLIEFLVQEGIALPKWLEGVAQCPWESREAFYKEIDSHKMKSLRAFLFKTRHLQAVFMARKLEATFPKLINSCSQSEREKMHGLLERLLKEPNGLYALVDYLNFKGSGILSKKMCKKNAWGLLQVLQKMPLAPQKPVVEFVKAAKEVLRQRVHHSPPEKREKQWLNGWFNRLETYTHTS